MIIDKRLIKYNYQNRKGNLIKYIVVHDTANTNISADAINHYRYFAGGNRKASAHYFVDDKRIVEIIEDAYASWHCGDGRGKYGITNNNSIGVKNLRKFRRKLQKSRRKYPITGKRTYENIQYPHKKCSQTL